VSRIEQLRKADDLADIAKILGYKPRSLSYLLYKFPDTTKYTVFQIPKSGGGYREIKSPSPHIKKLQQHLCSVLQDCLEEIYGSKSHSKSLSHGFRRAHSTQTNASNHKRRRFVFNVDLENFFTSINFGRVRGFFIKSNHFQLHPNAATVIAQIACHANALPQGSPASPVISNLIGHILDIRLVKLAKQANCSYSRYADDLTFSTREKEFPKLIAGRNGNHEWTPSPSLTKLIQDSGFNINPKEVSMQYKDGRQCVTGLSVNAKVNIPSPYYRQARAMCDSLFRFGAFYIGKEMRWGTSKEAPTKAAGTLSQLEGVLSYIYRVKKHHDQRDIREKWKDPTAIHKLYRKFLCYQQFHALNKPLMICEGKTDNVYIKCALKSLAEYYPSLIDRQQDHIIYGVDFFNYSNKNMDLLQFSGGTGDLASFIGKYKNMMRPYLSPGQDHPVIILVDNDSGAKPILSAASQVSGKYIDGSNPFYHLTNNLYLIILEKPPTGEEITIENLFDKKLLKEMIDGKTFNGSKDGFDKSRHYGKQVFAEKVVKAKQHSIDFSGFQNILNNVCDIMDHYHSLFGARSA